ncbi:LuxR family transcriptional regulator [Streptomyces sp. TG1A-8]|uniref:helix-turn-helix transcriptional regulator n=1 Tax=Streptomyces sp. TG1A-8 TaxID=3051385 RepID=UPI00265C50FF|nr:LuxR family transcriptional regulator [Streptomyces sp. TG1A-8]MDO0924993.1 LuxR family transcriptional regulator [Streptomyces sp. TG1A-8]
MVLFGRGEELGDMSALAEAALRGRGQAVFLGGPSGVSGTAFLDALDEAHASSFRVLRVTGHPDEAVLSFAAAERLVAPVYDRVEELPAPQRTALRVVFGLEEGSVDPLLLYMGVTRALQAAAGHTPLMILVDDFHLLDQESARVISFLSRRIDTAAILLVCAGADGHERHAGRIEGERPTLPPLGGTARLELREERKPACATKMKKRFVGTSRGIPALLRRAASGSTPGQLAGRAPLPGGPAFPDVPTGTAALGKDGAEPPRTSGAPDRSAGHGPVPASGHVSSTGPHPASRAALPAFDGFSAAMADGDFRRSEAAVETIETAERSLALGDTDRCADLLRRAEPLPSAEQRERYLRLQAVHTLLTRSPSGAVGQLLAAARTAKDAAFARDTLNIAIAAAWLAGNPSRLAEVRDAGAQPRGLPYLQPDADSTEGLVLLRILAGPWDPADRVGAGATGADRATGQEAARVPLPGFPMLPDSGLTDDPERHLAYYTGLLRRAVDGGEWGSVPVAAYWTACLEAWLGRWTEAMEHARLGLSSAERTRQDVLTGHLRSLLARLHGILGDVAACTAEAEACLRESATCVQDSVRLMARGALVFAALSEGRLEDAPGLLPLSATDVGESVSGGRGSLVVSDLIEAACRTFEVLRAAELLAVWKRCGPEARARGTEFLVLRCEALLEEDPDGMERRFREALALPYPNEFERGRTRLLFGERLRRARRPRSAREELVAAVDAFRSVGAPLWVDRAQRELDACAVRPSPAEEGWQALTVQERQVLQLAGLGMTNRQIAQKLFISPRTVGYHLYKAFPKLHIRSRRQIGAVVPASSGP